MLSISHSIGQNDKDEMLQIGIDPIYKDFVADDTGKRLSGVTVRVKGKASTDITDMFGEFTVRAKHGDIIMLSKNGEKIGSYVYDGSLRYEILNDSIRFKNKTNELSKSRKKSKTSRNNRSVFKRELDSANIFVRKNPTKSIQFVENALKLTRNKNDIAQLYEILADSYYHLKQYDLAYSNYKTASNNSKKSISLQLKLAKTAFLNNDFSSSLQYYNVVLKTSKIAPFQKISALEGKGDVYKNQNKITKALENYKAGLALANTHDVTPKITILNNKIADILSRIGELKKAEVYIDNAQNSVKRESKTKAIVQSNNAANFYKYNNSISEEVKFRKKTLEDLEDSDLKEIKLDDELETDKIGFMSHQNDILNSQNIKLDIANALKKQKDYSEAITYFKESALDANNNKDLETEKSAIQGLSEVYVELGDDKNALLNYMKYTKLVDAIYKNKERDISEAVALGKDLITKQGRILSLEKDRELNQSKFELFQSEQNLVKENDKRQKLIIYSLIGGLLLLLLSLFYMFRSNKQRRLANNLLALKSLRSQMNPHFIFNALNSVNSFIANNDERSANRYLTDFSTLMRSVLENSEQDFIPLEKEIELLKLYIKLEHTRFTDKFDFKFNINDNVKINEFQIPPMLLQPYVENAVWHGLRYKKDKGLLQIDIDQNDSETLKITITDNGIGRKQSKALKSKNQLIQKSKGMKNIKQRVNILNDMYKDKVDVFISDLLEDETGTKVVLTLKKD
jgi:tetratricopeptide (TPR) repeat protein